MFYSYKPGVAASRLARQLRTSIQYPGGGKGVNRRERRPIINWGVSHLSRELVGVTKTLNFDVRPALSKVESYRLWSAVKLPCPRFSASLEELCDTIPESRSVLARRDGLSKGRCIEVVRKGGERLVTPSFRPDFYVERLPYHREFRVHVFCGEVIHVQAKVGVDVVEGVVAKNFENGWEYTSQGLDRYITAAQRRDLEQLAVRAVEVVGLDFGAVDVLQTKNLHPYLLEVNTAPGLRSEASFAAYKEALKKLWQIH